MEKSERHQLAARARWDRREGGLSHGITGYQKRKCRCDICVGAVREYRQRTYVPKPRKPPVGPKCGTAYGYSAGCRCRECTAGQKLRMREYYAEHREELNAYKRQRRSDPDTQAAISEYGRKYNAANRARIDAADQKRQDLSAITAIRKSEPWTPAEDRVVLDSEMSRLEIALALKRTMNQVTHRRRKLRAAA